MANVDAQKVANSMTVGARGWEAFLKGMSTGDWADLIALFSDDFEFYFPIGEWHGLHKGKDKATEYFAFVNKCFPAGVTVTNVIRVTAGEDSYVVEFADEGVLFGNPYKNRIALAWDIRGAQICGQREYMGSDGKSN